MRPEDADRSPIRLTPALAAELLATAEYQHQRESRDARTLDDPCERGRAVTTAGILRRRIERLRSTVTPWPSGKGFIRGDQ